ncbi:UDP-N-acetylglucosamine 1-carboxyvinyltransferase [Laceyella putida]|uniref:UDP-N-acetylglucosamine 1-carboxyvinyltransferase n=1 Tax=Laceyella putida TaxID=110101 RepID=A0ABW2RMU2_9BACL
MERFVIKGGNPLSGRVRVQGAKNAALPILAATVLAAGTYEIHDVPRLNDIDAMCRILETLGAKVERDGHRVSVDTVGLCESHIPDELMSQIRSSVFLMGPLLARLGRVTVSRPGGCAIGKRPIDLHLKGLACLGAEVAEEGDLIKCRAPALTGAEIKLDFPSVGATENIMMAAVCAEGETVITNAAREPEIVDLAVFLNKMGAKVSGAGESTIVIQGVREMHATVHTIMPDRIVAGTLLIAAGATGGELVLDNVVPENLASVIASLRQMGLRIEMTAEGVRVKKSPVLHGIPHIMTAPYPGFPTDMQPQMITLLSLSQGTSRVTEAIFDSRLKHVDELRRMGAEIRQERDTVTIHGVKRLTGASVSTTDLRAGAALVIAALTAKGESTVAGVEHIDRGYERLDELIRQLGGQMNRVALKKQ